MACHLEKPREFEFRAGQFIDLSLLDPPETDSQGTTRAFTLASAPYEDDFMAATRIRSSAHKRVLLRLPEGVKLQVEGPIGSFLMHQRFRQKSSALVDRLMSSCAEGYSPEVRRNFFPSGPRPMAGKQQPRARQSRKLF